MSTATASGLQRRRLAVPDFADCGMRSENGLFWFFLVLHSSQRTSAYPGTPRGALRAQNKGCLRIYGFQGEAEEEGEGVTRITESSYRRIVPGKIECDVLFGDVF